jgi:hypothetical protein
MELDELVIGTLPGHERVMSQIHKAETWRFLCHRVERLQPWYSARSTRNETQNTGPRFPKVNVVPLHPVLPLPPLPPFLPLLP